MIALPDLGGGAGGRRRQAVKLLGFLTHIVLPKPSFLWPCSLPHLGCPNLVLADSGVCFPSFALGTFSVCLLVSFWTVAIGFLLSLGL